MSEQRKTLSFVGTAVATLLVAIGTYFMTQPARSTGFELVGKEFFENFEGGSQAGSLEVLAVDPDSAELKQFRVEEKDGVWTIPSHYGYPAEASDRLAQTASSLIGVSRDALVGRLESDHERFGVIDPLDEDNLDPESTGRRITIKDKDGESLVDLIIGKEAGESNASDSQLAFGQESGPTNYYVRRPDEAQTFKVALDLELSTRFSDWIRPDLLDLASADVRLIEIDNYELVEQADPLNRFTRLFKKQGDQMKFTRDTGFGPWDMDGLDAETDVLNSTKLNSAVTTLDSLKIVGVRKKTSYKDQQLLTADLKLNEIDELKNNIPLFRQIMAQLQEELADYGFNLTPVAQDTEELTIVSNAGEMQVGRENGVVYTMQFGNSVTGNEDDIEIGISTSKDTDEVENDSVEDSTDETAATETKQGDEASTADSGEEENENEDVKNRYLMIRVSFDESLLGDKPQAPIAPEEPVKPEGYEPMAETSEKTEGEGSDEEDNAPKPAESVEASTETESDDPETKTEEPQDDRPQSFKDFDLAMVEYKQAKTEYELKLSQFEQKNTEFLDKVSEGQKLVDELNQRFGKWFYVISAENLDSLQLSKTDLVSPKEAPDGESTTGDAGLPVRPNINLQPAPAPEPREGDSSKASLENAGAGQPESEPTADTDQQEPAAGKTELPSGQELPEDSQSETPVETEGG